MQSRGNAIVGRPTNHDLHSIAARQHFSKALTTLDFWTCSLGLNELLLKDRLPHALFLSLSADLFEISNLLTFPEVEIIRIVYAVVNNSLKAANPFHYLELGGEVRPTERAQHYFVEQCF